MYVVNNLEEYSQLLTKSLPTLS